MSSNAFDHILERKSQVPAAKKSYSRLTSGKKALVASGAKVNSYVNRSTRVKSPIKMTQEQLVKDIHYVASTAQIESRYGERRQSPSPARMSPELNRALARELYVESTVNVVSPGKNSPSKIRPGQMNLFNPKGQQNL